MKKITVSVSDEIYGILLQVQGSLKQASLKLEPKNAPKTTLAAAVEHCVKASAWSASAAAPKLPGKSKRRPIPKKWGNLP